jgi:uncharacterized membrane protein
MDKMLVVVFDNESQAYEGIRALKELDGDGTITLYSQAVIAKDAAGKVGVRQAADPGPLGTAVGLVTGGLVGVVGGPAGMVLGASAGAFGGSMFDLGETVVGSDFLDEAARNLEPGKAAVVAEVEEEWVTPLDTRMASVGGTVLRRTRGDVEHAQYERDIAAMEADIAAMDAEYQQASGEARAKLQARIDSAKARLQETRERGKARMEATQREAEAKLAALRDQAGRAGAEQQAQLDKRSTQVQADYAERTAKLDQAWQHSTEASRLAAEAVAP